MLKRAQSFEHPPGEAPHSRVDRVHPDLRKILETKFDGRQSEIVGRAVFERRGPFREIEPVSLNRCHGNGAAGEPGAPQFCERRLACDEATHTCRIPEHLVEALRYEVGLPEAQVETIRRRKRRRVEQHVPTALLRAGNPVERMLHAGAVRLRRIRKQAMPAARAPVEMRRQFVIFDTRVGQHDRHVRDGTAPGARVFAHAVD